MLGLATGAVGLVGGFVVLSIYNRLVRERNGVDNAVATIDVQLKLRCDLIPPDLGLGPRRPTGGHPRPRANVSDTLWPFDRLGLGSRRALFRRACPLVGAGAAECRRHRRRHRGGRRIAQVRAASRRRHRSPDSGAC